MVVLNIVKSHLTEFLSVNQSVECKLERYGKLKIICVLGSVEDFERSDMAKELVKIYTLPGEKNA